MTTPNRSKDQPAPPAPPPSTSKTPADPTVQSRDAPAPLPFASLGPEVTSRKD
jgi:hypothetical protein